MPKYERRRKPHSQPVQQMYLPKQVRKTQETGGTSFMSKDEGEGSPASACACLNCLVREARRV